MSEVREDMLALAGDWKGELKLSDLQDDIHYAKLWESEATEEALDLRLAASPVDDSVGHGVTAVLA